MLSYPHHVWAADFTEVWFQGRWVYIATVLDLYTREIVGVAVSIRKGAPLTIQALYNALLYHPRPMIFHSDNGKEYEAHVFIKILTDLGILISRSHPGCPWENGYQESFYGKFKLDLGDPVRCKNLGELVAAIYRTIHYYNTAGSRPSLRTENAAAGVCAAAERSYNGLIKGVRGMGGHFIKKHHLHKFKTKIDMFYVHSALWAGLQGEYRCPSRQPTLGRKCLNLNQKKCKFLYLLYLSA